MTQEKLWCDLQTDVERIEFLQSGRACETGIIAPAIVNDIIAQYRKLQAVKQVLTSAFEPDHCNHEVRNFAERVGHAIESIPIEE